jgi:hypothetical protein
MRWRGLQFEARCGKTHLPQWGKKKKLGREGGERRREEEEKNLERETKNLE